MIRELPHYKLIGEPRKVRTHRQECVNYYQFYALLSAPNNRLRAPCTRDFKVSKQKAIAFVESHIKKSLAKTDPTVACADYSLEQHITTYKEALENDENTRKHIKQTIGRIRCICNGLDWKKIADVDGLKMKSWLKKQKGMGDQTRLYYVGSFKSFTKFLAENRQIAKDPLAYFKTKQKGDKPKPTRIRRALTPDEMNRLIAAAEKSKSIIRRLNGEQRAWLYRMACAVGFRAHELASLTPLSFSLDEGCVLLERNMSKRRRYDRVELHPSLIDGLRTWLADKPSDRRLWNSSWWNTGAAMIRVDLKVAGIPAVNDAGHVVDFHSLRVSFVTNLVGTHTPESLVQRIARLSTARLLERYYKPRDEARVEAIAAMPTFA